MKLTGVSDDKSIIVIAGPTASGKTDAAIQLAKSINGEIISADSRQVYKYLDIGTAKSTPAQQREVRHHLIDFLDPDKIFDAGQFVYLCNKAISDIRRRNKQPIIAGGTGLYIKAIMDGLAKLPKRNDAIREKLNRILVKKGVSQLFNELKKVDPETAHTIDPHNPARIIRALEVFLMTGNGMQYHHKKTKKPPYSFTFFCLLHSKEVLMKRIIKRTDMMLKKGLIEETQDILRKGWKENCPGFLSLGYKQVIQFIKGSIDRKTLRQSIITDTWQYAKRQNTWFNKVNLKFKI